MKKALFILLALSIPVLLLAAEPVREWKSKNGYTIQAAYDGSRDTDPATVPLIRNGKKIIIQFDKLSQADQDYVTKIRNDGRSLDDEFGVIEAARSIEIVPAGNRYALLIGVNEYAKPIRSLDFCVNDMKLLAECFEKIGVPKENIFLVTDDSPAERRPTGANIRQQIENLTQLMGQNDQLTIAFSGHGAMVDGKSYLCPSDTNLDNRDSIVSREWAFEQLEKCKAKQKIFIIDACRDEVSFGGQKALGGARTLEDPIGADTHGFILIASCDKKQKSWEHPNLKHGVFTYYLAEGLSGAVKDEDGYVSILNLFQYASAKTKKFVIHEFNKVQVPTFRPGGEMTDFCLAKLDNSFPNPTPAIVPTPVETLKAGDRKTYTVNGVEFAFRWCPPGTFMMGSPRSEEGHTIEETQHEVTLTKGYWIMETEVTQKQWQAVMGNNPSKFKGNDLPVETVSWNDCQEFCKKCTQLGLPVQLPTEAQWEYACRAGSTTAYFWGAALNGDHANCNGNNPCGTTIKGKYLEKTTPVYNYEANSWGLYDMHGNVWEWCQDWYGRYPSESVTDPAGSTSGSCHVCRGGSWFIFAWGCRSACRYYGEPDYQSDNLGFRGVLGQ